MAKVIMVQGTMSNVGKSVLTAALCRIFKQDGYRVAPFKSQNMALNSFITKEGLEMGRAQVMQAEAAGMEPSVRMNPILLKPTCDTGSQVIVNGVPLGNMSAREYFKRKKELIPDIMKAYQSLSEEADIIVIEGAGSPAEINLKADDIVNMGMAELVDAPVLLVGDIDRGGVFAQLYGTIELLEEKEKTRIKGLIINKFRGDKSILDPGVIMLEEKCKIPVLGVTPYLKVDLEDEDSLSERFDREQEVDRIDLAVIRLPRISNFTDFNVLEQQSGVSVRYVSTLHELQNPDVIFLPGTKNTIEDLLWLRQSGLEAAILKHAAQGKVVFGICGGYQMLGETIYDPEGVETKHTKERNGESDGQQGNLTVRGLGLLPCDTIFEEEKVRTRVKAEISKLPGILSGMSEMSVEGYEIHMGVTSRREDTRAGEFSAITKYLQTPDRTKDKKDFQESEEVSLDGTAQSNVYGTYLHGVFDAEGIAVAFIEAVARSKGISWAPDQTMTYQEYKEEQYDKLADGIRKHLNMEAIYRILNQQ